MWDSCKLLVSLWHQWIYSDVFNFQTMLYIFLTCNTWILLLRCDEKALEDSLCKRVIVTRDETITKNLDPESAVHSRDSLAKIVYTRLFDWQVYCDYILVWFIDLLQMICYHWFLKTFLYQRLVNKINSTIGQDPESKCLIGVLDIYGFESFKTNRCLTGMLFV